MNKFTNIPSEINDIFKEKRGSSVISALTVLIDALGIDNRNLGGKKRGYWSAWPTPSLMRLMSSVRSPPQRKLHIIARTISVWREVNIKNGDGTERVP